MDPLAELQHRHRQTIHDVKGTLACANNSLLLAEKRPESLHHNMEVVRNSLERLLDNLDPGWRDRTTYKRV